MRWSVFPILLMAMLGISPRPAPLVALGDSISYGYPYATTHASRYAFPFRIARRLHWPVTNLAHSGWSSPQLFAHINRPPYAHAISHAHTITIDIGTNDLLHRKPNIPWNVVERHLYRNVFAILEHIRQYTPHATILVYLLYPLRGVPTPVIQQSNTEIRHAASQYNAVVVNPSAIFMHPKRFLVADRIHPNLRGQAYLAHISITALKESGMRHPTLTK